MSASNIYIITIYIFIFYFYNYSCLKGFWVQIFKEIFNKGKHILRLSRCYGMNWICQLSISIMKYLWQLTYKDKKSYFVSWFSRFQSKINRPHYLGPLMRATHYGKSMWQTKLLMWQAHEQEREGNMKR
jgi:hypothetical protein